MIDIANFSPLWGVWSIEKPLGSGTSGDVYEVRRIDANRQYAAAVKHISIPPKGTSIQALYADGTVTDESSAQRYCQSLLDALLKEIDICYELKGYTNFVSYEDHMIVPRRGEIGFDIFIRMELLTSLQTYITANGITLGGITKLCEDMCTALNVLEQKSIIHRDIKPANIFVNAAGDFKLGDFGVARHMEGLGSMSVKGTYNYMAPEILKGGVVGANSDLYSLGLVLYRLLNNNRAPFLPPPPAQISYEEDQSALDRRLSGEVLPPPSRAELSLPLTNVIMRACEYIPGGRFQSANEMKQALQDFRNFQSAAPHTTGSAGFDPDATVAVERSAIRSTNYGAGGFSQSANPQGSFVGMGNSGNPSGFAGSIPPSKPQQAASNKTMFTIIFAALGFIVVLLIILLVLFLPGMSGPGAPSNAPSAQIASATPTQASAPTQTPTPTPTPTPTLDISEIEEIISSYTSLSNVAVSVANLDSGEIYSTINSNVQFIASGMYLPVYIAAGGANAASTYSGYLSDMLKNKNNQSANVIIDSFGGLESINEILRINGFSNTTQGRLYGDVNASNKGYENFTTSANAVEMLMYIYDDGGYTNMYSDLAAEGISVPRVGGVYAHTGQGIGTSYNIFLILIDSDTSFAVSILTNGMGSTWDSAKKSAIPMISTLLGNINTQMEYITR